MHTKPMSETDGTFTDKRGTPCPETKCHKCDQAGAVMCKVWESSCGGYEDYKYTCGNCGHVWWIDGIDS